MQRSYNLVQIHTTPCIWVVSKYYNIGLNILKELHMSFGTEHSIPPSLPCWPIAFDSMKREIKNKLKDEFSTFYKQIKKVITFQWQRKKNVHILLLQTILMIHFSSNHHQRFTDSVPWLIFQSYPIWFFLYCIMCKFWHNQKSTRQAVFQ